MITGILPFDLGKMLGKFCFAMLDIMLLFQRGGKTYLTYNPHGKMFGKGHHSRAARLNAVGCPVCNECY